jgi:hypothetical protein
VTVNLEAKSSVPVWRSSAPSQTQVTECKEGIVLWRSMILLRDGVMIDRVWIGNGYIGHPYSSSLHFTNHYHTKTRVPSHGLHCADW